MKFFKKRELTPGLCRPLISPRAAASFVSHLWSLLICLVASFGVLPPLKGHFLSFPASVAQGMSVVFWEGLSSPANLKPQSPQTKLHPLFSEISQKREWKVKFKAAHILRMGVVNWKYCAGSLKSNPVEDRKQWHYVPLVDSPRIANAHRSAAAEW